MRKTTPHLWPKKVETYSPSREVVRNLREELLLGLPYHNNTKKENRSHQQV